MAKHKDHIVILNWDDRVESIIDQLCDNDVLKRMKIVIMTSEKENPLHKEYRDVHHLGGDITNAKHLEKTYVHLARSVLIVSDSRDHLSDGKSIMAILAIRKICDEKNNGKSQVPITAEINDWKNYEMAKRAGNQYDGKIEVISSSHLGANLLTQCAVTPGIAGLYDDLLTFKKNTNEIYRIELPAECLGKRFSELSEWFLRKRAGSDLCAIPLGISRKDQTFINPADSEAGPLQEGDYVFVIADAPPSP